MPNEQPARVAFDARRAQWLKGVLDLCVLGLIGNDTTYGYELAARFEHTGLGTIKGGTLYPRLTAMEKDGLLAAEWRPGDGGPGRKYYRVSDKGRALLAEGSIEWTTFAERVGELISAVPTH